MAAEQELLDLPLIDLSICTPEEICKTHKEYGFLCLVNHGVPERTLQNVLDLQRQFFMSSVEYKTKFSVDEGYRREGYNATPRKSCFGMDITRESLYLYLKPAARRNLKKWPQTHRDIIERLGDASIPVYEKLISKLSLAIGLDASYMKNTLSPNGSLKQTLCTFYYPVQREGDGVQVFGVPEHTDIGTLVFLFADEVPSLQVFKDGKWRTIRPVPGSLVVSIGEIMEVTSNGFYRAPLHRVILKRDKPRYSCAITFEPSDETKIGPARSLGKPFYRQFIYKERYKEYEQGRYTKNFAMLPRS